MNTTPKCFVCGRPRGDHKARTLNCPVGTKHRTMGYSFYGITVYIPKTIKGK